MTCGDRLFVRASDTRSSESTVARRCRVTRYCTPSGSVSIGVSLRTGQRAERKGGPTPERKNRPSSHSSDPPGWLPPRASAAATAQTIRIAAGRPASLFVSIGSGRGRSSTDGHLLAKSAGADGAKSPQPLENRRRFRQRWRGRLAPQEGPAPGARQPALSRAATQFHATRRAAYRSSAARRTARRSSRPMT